MKTDKQRTKYIQQQHDSRSKLTADVCRRGLGRLTRDGEVLLRAVDAAGGGRGNAQENDLTSVSDEVMYEANSSDEEGEGAGDINVSWA